ncbi:hypothetical protein ACTWQB_08790 [Piscibacillus sp. B03]|uniref:hypothetical protein n=1 Tax=Piscibacillus sp. B03 TaxID=3457430 RepID=UPI003FCE9D18
MSDFSFNRVIRTPSSEQYIVEYWNEEIGQLNVHFMKNTSHEVCSLFITSLLEEFEIDDLINEIIDKIISYEEDFFVIEIYKGNYVSSYVNSPHPYNVSAKQEDLSKILNTFQVAKGQLSEVATMEYFRKLGYTMREATATYDKVNKVDLIGENESEILYIQVKLGMIGEKEIKKIISKISKINDSNKIKYACIVAEKFPMRAEVIRNQLQNKLGLKVMFVHKYQIIESGSKYKRTIK